MGARGLSPLFLIIEHTVIYVIDIFSRSLTIDDMQIMRQYESENSLHTR